MTSINDFLKNRDDYLERIEKETINRLRSSPDGSLKVSESKGKIQYYHRKCQSDRSGKYIPKKDIDLVKALAQKAYDKELYKTIHDEREAIYACLKRAPKCAPENVFDSLSENRKKLVVPGIETDEMFIDRWQNVSYKGKDFPADFPKLFTEKGERVRSKSEMIIADMLAKENIPYRYEYPIRLKGLGIVYPDFTVLNVRLRKEMIWEHQGMMDNPEYAENAVRKVMVYQLNEIYPGDRLILTSETLLNPINTRLIKGIIEHYLV